MHGTVRAALCTDVVTIGPDAPLSAAEALLVAQPTPELYVVSPGGLLLGVLPDYEVLKLRLLGVPADALRVADVMAAHLEAATPDTPLGEVACRLRANVHARMPVTDEGRLVGYVSRQELLAVLLRIDAGAAPPAPATEPETAPQRSMPRAPNFLRGVHAAAAGSGV